MHASLQNVLRLMICRNINIPWNHKGMGDGDYMYAFQQIVMPVAHEFDPDFVIGESLSVSLSPTLSFCITYDVRSGSGL